MPVKPIPYKLKCPMCCWSRVVMPRSDVVCEADMPEHCPNCGEKVNYQELSKIGIIFGEMRLKLLRPR